MPEPHVTTIAFVGAIFITYLVYKFNLLADGNGVKGTRQKDSKLEKIIFNWLERQFQPNISENQN